MKRYEPKVSIVIPAYNAANYLAEAVDSALAQSYSNVEIIVVNDGSKDNGATAEVARRYGDKIRYIEKENGGSSSALNTGIRNMTGEWFSWLSHDDLYYPGKLEEEIRCLNQLIESGVSDESMHKHLFFGAADLIDGDGKIIRKESQRNIQKTSAKINCPQGTLNLIAIPTQDGFHGCSCLIHRRAFDDIGMFDENLRLLNDMDLWFRFYSSGYVVHFVPKVLVAGRVHAKQVSRSIGFSYHNPEQDMFWNRSLQWLLQNHPDNYELFYLFGKTALMKTRYEEGKQAFAIAGIIQPQKKLALVFEKIGLMIFSKCKVLAKKIFLLLFS